MVKSNKIVVNRINCSEKRSRISQSDVPCCSIVEALRIPQAIMDHYAGKPTSPLNVALALGVSPNSGPFKMLCGAALAYGLTNGGYNSKEIVLEDHGKRIVSPLKEGDDSLAKKEAFLRPRVIGDFLKKYTGNSLPRHEIALNVLKDMGVPSDRTEKVFDLVLDGAKYLGLLKELKDKIYVDLDGVPSQNEAEATPSTEEIIPSAQNMGVINLPTRGLKKVFITHGKDISLIEPIKKLLKFGELEAVISVERQSVSQPLPDKVMNDMRMCSAAIIHVDLEPVDVNQQDQAFLNPNVLIEIGAAMALYGRRLVLLVKDGLKLPSNLQGLYEVRYTGSNLDGISTIKLLEAINDIKNHSVPAIT
jgi:predicted nucleotide-binding protein